MMVIPLNKKLNSLCTFKFLLNFDFLSVKIGDSVVPNAQPDQLRAVQFHLLGNMGGVTIYVVGRIIYTY